MMIRTRFHARYHIDNFSGGAVIIDSAESEANAPDRQQMDDLYSEIQEEVHKSLEDYDGTVSIVKPGKIIVIPVRKIMMVEIVIHNSV